MMLISPIALIPNLLAAGLTQYTSTKRLWKTWESPTPREKDATALACLGYTNREIGARLHISPETVKDRLGSAYRKFNVRTRSELRMLLSVWDFSEWDRQQQAPPLSPSPKYSTPIFPPTNPLGWGFLFI